ncbi:MAG: hypothetical protein ACOVNU_12580 [Candidatus Kapaibacteriota bacterium]
MSFTLIINNSNVVNTNTNATYEYKFIGGGFSVPENMECMVSSAQIPYSIFNITAAYGNNTVRLSFPSGAGAATFTDYNIVIPDGFYTIDDLTAFFQQYAITNGLYLINANNENVYYTPTFYINSVSYAVQLLLYVVPRSLPTGWTQPSNWIGYSTYTADRTPHIHILATSKFGDFVGLTTGTYPTPTLRTTNYSVLSNKTPIGSYVNSIVIHSSLVNNSVVSPSDIIDAFQIVDTKFGSNINYQPSVEKYVRLTKGTYNSMIIYLTDQNNNPITLKDNNLLITLLFKKII